MATIKRAGPEILVNTTGGFHQQPTVTGKGGPVNESILVAWSNSTDNQIRGQRLEAVGGLKEGAEFLMATSTTNIIRHRAIDGLPFSGGYIAVWLDETAHQVKGQRYAGDGSKVGDEVIVGNADGEEGALQPAILSLSGVGVVMTNSNDFAVAWTGQKVGSSAFPPRPWVQIFRSSGTSLTSLGTFPVNTTLDDNNPFHFGPEMSQLANGAFVVAWTHQRAVGGPHILGQIFHPDGSKSGGEFKINTNTSPQKCDIAVTGLSDGLSTGKGFVGAWVVARPLQGGTEVRAQIFNFDGSRVDDFETFITGETEGSFRNPALTTLVPHGGFVAAWTEKSATSGDPSGDAVRAQVFTADGSEDSDKILVNTTTNGDQFGQTMTFSFDNHFVVAWVSDEGPPGGDMSVRAQVFEVL